ncbi:hypothetical protein P9209_07780 [Prescottella defluvii]|nr:hypothetical protein P9209_07780 [Prescottella defluvii]
MTIRHTVIDTAAPGPVTIMASDAAVTGVYFRHHIRRPAQKLLGPPVSFVDDAILGRPSASCSSISSPAHGPWSWPPTASASTPWPPARAAIWLTGQVLTVDGGLELT